MAKPKPHIWLFACLLGLFLWTCDAPRNNPLDPLNPNAEWANLAGTARSNTSEILSDVLIRWNDSMTTSDQNGQYLFEKIKPTDGMLYFSKSGFIDDSSYIEWNGRTNITHNITLRRNPILSGHVETESYPRSAISNVKVTWHLGQQYAFTNENGNFIFENPVPGDGLITFEKEGFRTFETTVKWPDMGDADIDAYLNANPQLQDFSLFSAVTNYYEPRLPTYEMVARARLTDAEGDIENVYIECSALALKMDLQYNVIDKVFERSFSTRDLSLESMLEVVGYDFDLVVVEESGDEFKLAQQRVVRVINNVIDIESPKNGESVDYTFWLKWKNPYPGFKFTYHAKIYTNDDFTPELVWEKENIAAEAESLEVELNDATEYLWEIWCVDEFYNRSRSKPGSFSVEE